ncbi:probable E3 ubiquitin-protein ligase bre1 [Oppia nitens]|uniref:probable E3 ubiquitin-protein ligase bre1 n=1 Tax=Oppia nitens TaxID=1686743 RepID=UPI0023DCB1FD|nr:probable E3 ubiquitin-protein ligase bre1 [Oppia nitens]
MDENYSDYNNTGNEDTDGFGNDDNSLEDFEIIDEIIINNNNENNQNDGQTKLNCIKQEQSGGDNRHTNGDGVTTKHGEANKRTRHTFSCTNCRAKQTMYLSAAQLSLSDADRKAQANRIRELGSESQKLKAILNDQVIQLELKLNAKDKEMDDLMSQISQMTAKTTQLSAQISCMQNNETKLIEEIQNLTDDKIGLKECNEELITKLSHMKAEVKTITTEKGKLRESGDDRELEINELKQNHNKLMDDFLNQCKRKITTKNRKIEKLKTKLTKQTQESTDLEKKYKDVIKDNVLLKNSRTNLMNKMNDKNEELQKWRTMFSKENTSKELIEEELKKTRNDGIRYKKQKDYYKTEKIKATIELNKLRNQRNNEIKDISNKFTKLGEQTISKLKDQVIAIFNDNSNQLISKSIEQTVEIIENGRKECLKHKEMVEKIHCQTGKPQTCIESDCNKTVADSDKFYMHWKAKHSYKFNDNPNPIQKPSKSKKHKSK